jgi:3-hydroxybutyrate dehydrogenase
VSLRAAIVTGAASGMGRAVVERLAHDDWDVLAVDLEPDPDGPGVPHAADLTERGANEAWSPPRSSGSAAWTPSSRTQGSSTSRPSRSSPRRRGTGLLAKHAWPALRESGGGRIVVVASVHGLVASPFKAGYVPAKHGVLGLVKTLRSRGSGRIGVSAVCPGYLRTPLVESQLEAQAAAHGIPVERVVEDVLLAQQAVKELLAPEDAANAVAYLLGPAGRFAAGAPLVLDGGWTAR